MTDKVTDYIPEYGGARKGDTTIAHVLAHRAGVPGLPKEALDLERVSDREFLCRTICEAEPFVRPGALLAYHAVSGGFILREIVQRVTGRSLREILGAVDPRPAAVPLGQLRRRTSPTSARWA